MKAGEARERGKQHMMVEVEDEGKPQEKRRQQMKVDVEVEGEG